jgi:hypothetical protein
VREPMVQTRPERQHAVVGEQVSGVGRARRRSGVGLVVSTVGLAVMTGFLVTGEDGPDLTAGDLVIGHGDEDLVRAVREMVSIIR